MRVPLLSATATLAFLGWMVVVIAGYVQLVARPFDLPFWDGPLRNHATQQMWVALGLIVLACLGAALLARCLAPAATLPATFTAGGLVLVVAAVGSASVDSLLVALAVFALSWLVGDIVLSRLPVTDQAPIVRVPIAIMLGNGILGLLLLALASLGRLNTSTTLGGAAIILVAAVALDRNRFSRARSNLRGWRSTTPSWFETIIIALTVAIAAYAALAAFVPEVHSDATRQHLPIAREIWQTGTAPEFPPLGTSTSPIHAHMLYAVAHGFGGMTATKLVHTFTGLVALLGIAGIGWLGAGRTAATVAAAIFAAMPLVLWEMGTAYVDLFPAAFAVAAVLAVLTWQRDGHLAWLVVAGALAGFGFAAKMTMGLMVVALAVAIGLVGRRDWRRRDRIVAVVAFGLGTLVVIPWLWRSYTITGAVPGLSILTGHVTGAAAETSDLPNFGLGRSPLDLLRIPWALTFQGELFNQGIGGDVGIGLLLFLPLLLLLPRTRLIAFLIATALLSYVGWAITAQYTRYLLPTLALAAALCGIAVAPVLARPVTGWRRLLALAAPSGVVLSLVAAALFSLPDGRFTIPMDVLTGRSTAADYIEEKIPAARMLATASALFPPDTPIGFFGIQREGAQIYTEARLTYFPADPVSMAPQGILIDLDLLGTTAGEVLASFDRLGVDHFIWSRTESRVEDWRSTVLSTPFLRENTRILAGADNAYLFEIVPGGGDWGVSDQNLLDDPALRTVGSDGPWEATGRARTRKGALRLTPRDSIAQEVPVSAGNPYLLFSSGQCRNPADASQLTLRWLDERGETIDVTTEWVIPGVEGSDQFLWHVAPERAASVSVEISSSRRGTGGRCEFEQVALYGPA